MIKSIKINNFSVFEKQQALEFFNDFSEKKKTVNYVFGLSGSGKSSLFKLIKATIFYIKRWAKFSADDDILTVSKKFCLNTFFNPNINFSKNSDDNFVDIEFVFANSNFEYKYCLSFNEKTCNYEHFYYRDQKSEQDWKPVFLKDLLSIDFINEKYESLFSTKIFSNELGLDFDLQVKEVDMNNSIFSYVISMDKTKNIKAVSDIIEKIVFLDEHDFDTLNDLKYPCKEFVAYKESIFRILKLFNFNISDIAVNKLNKATGIYDLNIYLHNTTRNSGNPKFISTNQFSKEEFKILILAFLYFYYSFKDKIILIDDMTLNIRFDIFYKISEQIFNNIDNFEKNNGQIICFNGDYFNKIKAKFLDYFNFFYIHKNLNSFVTISKVTRDCNLDDDYDLERVKTLLHLEDNDELFNLIKDIYETKIASKIKTDDYIKPYSLTLSHKVEKKDTLRDKDQYDANLNNSYSDLNPKDNQELNKTFSQLDQEKEEKELKKKVADFFSNFKFDK
ncbi:MAG: ATP-binding protein [Malacoplasma sp.]|nr:ATP-binding protein [Malacoplasma sp.]